MRVGWDKSGGEEIDDFVVLPRRRFVKFISFVKLVELSQKVANFLLKDEWEGMHEKKQVASLVYLVFFFFFIMTIPLIVVGMLGGSSLTS